MPHRRVLVVLAALLWAGPAPRPHAAEPAPLPAFTPWDVKALETPPAFEWVDRDANVRSLLYRAELYRGKPTRVFAFYASPATLGLAKDDGGRFPGMVLVHGGGGRAFRAWAELYARRGYAAIAMDLGGRMGNDARPFPEGGPPQDDHTKLRMSE